HRGRSLRPDAPGSPGGAVGARRAHQPRDRRTAVPQRAHGRVPPAQGLPEAWRREPQGASGGARELIPAGRLGLRVTTRSRSWSGGGGRTREYGREMSASQAPDLQSRCDLLRSLHLSGAPLLLPNAWDVASAKAVVEAGFPVVATTSAGVAATL